MTKIGHQGGQQSFKAFGSDHLVTLAVLLALIAFVFWTARHWTASRRLLLGRVLGIVLLGYVIAAYTQRAMMGELSWEYSLPLELCHMVLIACIVALFRPHQPASEVAYFWGFAGTLHATLTPDLGQGFPSWEFIQFFWGHGAILLAVVYLIAGRGFRPRPRSVLRMLVWVNIYALIVGTIDWVFNWNYGYLRNPPMTPSLIDYLGPWPWYILSLELIALFSFWILDLPWRLTSRNQLTTKAPRHEEGS